MAARRHAGLPVRSAVVPKPSAGFGSWHRRGGSPSPILISDFVITLICMSGKSVRSSSCFLGELQTFSTVGVCAFPAAASCCCSCSSCFWLILGGV